jgi:squalene cyclase
MTTGAIDPGRLDAVIAAAQAWALGRLDRQGFIDSPGHAGVGATLYAVVTLHAIDAVRPDEAEQAGRYLRQYQQRDGSFTNYFTAAYDSRAAEGEGDLSMTALAASVLRLLGGAENEAAGARASAFVSARGGAEALARELYALKVTPLYVALAGDLDPGLLPDLPAEPLLLPPVQKLTIHRVNVAFVWMLVAVWAVIRGLKSPAEVGSPSWLARIEHRAAVDLIVQFQNPEGDWNYTVFQTTLALAALRSLGVPADDERMKRGVGWLHRQRDVIVDPVSGKETSLYWHQFTTGIWSTALTLRALFCSGVARSDPRVAKGVDWLMAAQLHGDLPALQPMPAGAPRHGGWAFERRNVTVPDADDTAVALGALAMALQGEPGERLDEARAERVRASIDEGLSYLLAMQNPDGGWPAFQQGLPSKPPGPIYTHYPQFEPGAPIEDIVLAAHNSIMLGDPATEDVTGRALFGLAQLGYTKDSPVVDAAVGFLVQQQCTLAHLGGSPAQGEGGPWWSRWICNYLAATSYVIGGLAAVGVDPQAPVIRRAVEWTALHQNQDGGWGEAAISYQDPSQAGMGPSTPLLTGLVLCGLIQAGQGRTPMVERGVRYLLERAGSDGLWPDTGMLHVFYRTDTMYVFVAPQAYYPLEALGRYRAVVAGSAPEVAVGGADARSLARAEGASVASSDPVGAARDAGGGWSAAWLESMRAVGDAEADAVVRGIFDAGEVDAVNDLLRRLTGNDGPLPPGLPPAVADYFERTAELPGWADPAAIRAAEEMFARVGWGTAIALFNASLPQCYADGNGAQVLAGTESLGRDAERRIFETAQFLFDVADRGALAPGGAGIRSAQKVRLVHAAVRHLTLRLASWDMAFGVPVNQEDLALTLMTFSVVVADAWRRMGLEITPDEDEAWLHAWKVVGHVLGIHPALLPRDCADARALWGAICGAQWRPCEAGRKLAAALLGVSERWLPPPVFGDLSKALMRHFSGDRCADILGISPAGPTEDVIVAAARGLSHLGDPARPPPLVGVLQAVAREIMKGLVTAQRAGKPAPFRIPPALADPWGTGG